MADKRQYRRWIKIKGFDWALRKIGCDGLFFYFALIHMTFNPRNNNNTSRGDISRKSSKKNRGTDRIELVEEKSQGSRKKQNGVSKCSRKGKWKQKRQMIGK